MKTNFCPNCGNKIDDNAQFCSSCGNSMNSNTKPTKKGKKPATKGQKITLIVLVVIAVILLGVTAGLNPDSSVPLEKYELLDPKELHQAYVDNEIAAKEKYVGNYYKIEGKINDINQKLGDQYLIMMFKAKDGKTIQVNGYFTNDEELKTLKKDETTTIYCKFIKRSIENYMGVTTSYKFENCRLK